MNQYPKNCHASHSTYCSKHSSGYLPKVLICNHNISLTSPRLSIKESPKRQNHRRTSNTIPAHGHFLNKTDSTAGSLPLAQPVEEPAAGQGKQCILSRHQQGRLEARAAISQTRLVTSCLLTRARRTIRTLPFECDWTTTSHPLSASPLMQIPQFPELGSANRRPAPGLAGLVGRKIWSTCLPLHPVPVEGRYVVDSPHLLSLRWMPIPASLSPTNAVKSTFICSWAADGMTLVSPVVPSHWKR